MYWILHKARLLVAILLAIMWVALGFGWQAYGQSLATEPSQSPASAEFSETATEQVTEEGESTVQSQEQVRTASMFFTVRVVANKNIFVLIPPLAYEQVVVGDIFYAVDESSLTLLARLSVARLITDKRNRRWASCKLHDPTIDEGLQPATLDKKKAVILRRLQNNASRFVNSGAIKDSTLENDGISGVKIESSSSQSSSALPSASSVTANLLANTEALLVKSAAELQSIKYNPLVVLRNAWENTIFASVNVLTGWQVSPQLSQIRTGIAGFLPVLGERWWLNWIGFSLDYLYPLSSTLQMYEPASNSTSAATLSGQTTAFSMWVIPTFNYWWMRKIGLGLTVYEREKEVVRLSGEGRVEAIRSGQRLALVYEAHPFSIVVAKVLASATVGQKMRFYDSTAAAEAAQISASAGEQDLFLSLGFRVPFGFSRWPLWQFFLGGDGGLKYLHKTIAPRGVKVTSAGRANGKFSLEVGVQPSK